MEHYEYIAHHGILGMRWGVRNYQNEDGSLTPEGRKRYGVGERGANTHFKKSDVYAMEGAKRGGLLGAAVGKAVGVYKERKERKQDPNGLTKDERKIFDDADAIEKKALYDWSVLDRSSSKENVNRTKDQLQKLCDAHFDKLAGALESVYGRKEVFNQQDSLFGGSFARQLALRFNERFDVDGIFDQHMDEWVRDYSQGLISKSQFKNHYEAELNDQAAWLIDTFNKDDLAKIAKTFVDGDDLDTPNDSYRSYLKGRGKDDPYQESSGRYTIGSKQKGQISNAIADQMIRKNSSKNMSGVASAAKALRKTGNYTNEEIAKMLSLSIGELDNLLYA